jgi:Family of unknown function (DUF6221)
MTDFLVAFLLARLAEDEGVARKVPARGGGPRPAHWTAAELQARGFPAVDALVAAHVARWDPARVVAECRATRAAVELAARDDGGLPVLRALVQPYGDHPDFRPEWRRTDLPGRADEA